MSDESSEHIADRRRTLSGIVLVALAVLLFSTSPVLVRWAAPLSPFEISFGRLALAGLLILGLAVLLREAPLRVLRRDRSRFLLWGLVTALHFIFYIASLSFTLISHALALVYTAPIFVALLSRYYLHEPLPLRKYLGIGVAVLGVAIMAGFEPALDGRIVFGDFLALLSAVSFGIYSVVGRSQRHRYPLLTYAGGVYSSAAIWLVPLVLGGIAARSAGFAAALPEFNMWVAAAAVLALGLGPLAIGHTLYNAGLRRTSATYVNLIATQEVTGGIILGILLLNEIPSPAAVAGVAVTLLGIILVLR